MCFVLCTYYLYSFLQIRIYHNPRQVITADSPINTRHGFPKELGYRVETVASLYLSQRLGCSYYTMLGVLLATVLLYISMRSITNYAEIRHIVSEFDRITICKQ